MSKARKKKWHGPFQLNLFILAYNRREILILIYKLPVICCYIKYD